MQKEEESKNDLSLADDEQFMPASPLNNFRKMIKNINRLIQRK